MNRKGIAKAKISYAIIHSETEVFLFISVSPALHILRLF